MNIRTCSFLLTITTITTVALLALAGCATSGSGGGGDASGQQAARIAGVAELAAFTGTTLRLSQHPEDRPAFVAASTALGLLINSTNITPADLSQALSGLPIRELEGERGALIVGSALIFYNTFLNDRVNLDRTPHLRTIATGVHGGLRRALITGAPAQ